MFRFAWSNDFCRATAEDLIPLTADRREMDVRMALWRVCMNDGPSLVAEAKEMGASDDLIHAALRRITRSRLGLKQTWQKPCLIERESSAAS